MLKQYLRFNIIIISAKVKTFGTSRILILRFFDSIAPIVIKTAIKNDHKFLNQVISRTKI